MKLLLDTHIWIWWIQGSSNLLPHHVNLIEHAEKIFVSSISCWEVAMLVQGKRLTLNLELQEWLELALAKSGVEVISLSQEIALQAVELPKHHKDPADRFIMATSIQQRLNLLSYDSKFHLYSELKSHLLQT